LVNIVSETKKEPINAAPPTNARPHMWLPAKDAELLKLRLAENRPLPAYVNKHAEAKMRNHALSMRKNKIEVMGLLLGEVRRWKDRDYVIVRDVVTTDLDATAVSVKFDSVGFEKLFEKLDNAGFDYVVVGWYHSHPGYGCFMSETDLKTHSGIFVSHHQIAMVIDPLKFQISGFVMRDGKAVPEDFAVYWDEYDDPYGGLERIKRK
jgi:26S proteasome regulatory subunit N11